MLRLVFAVGVLAAGLCVSAGTQPLAPALFDFHVSFWNSLHHELHASVRPKPASPTPVPDDLPALARTGWTHALDGYRPLARRSLLFDEGLAALSSVLSSLPDDAPLDAAAIAPSIKGLLNDAAPAYRAAAWPAHQRDAQAFIEALSPLIAQHGPVIATALTSAYGATWPGPVPVDLVRDVGPPGNAHTTVRPLAHVTIAATDPRHQGLAALEVLFHEASHGWDAALTDELTSAARSAGRVVRGDLWHAVLFFTAGEITRRTLAAAGRDYVPYAVAQGLSTGAYATVWPAVVATWTPWLSGGTTRRAAVEALVRAVGVLPPG